MIWYTPVIIRLVTAYVLAPFMQKRIAGLKSRPKRLSLMFFFCAVMSILISSIWEAQINITVGLIMIVGAVNAFGTYCQWSAMNISLSRNSLFTVWDDIIAMTLSYFILRESQFMSLRLGLGIFLSLLAVFLFVLNDFKFKNSEKQTRIDPSFYVFVFCYSIIWGLALFLMKYWAVKTVPISNFTLGWYLGAFIGSLAVLKISKKIDTENSKTKLTKKDVFALLVLGFLTFISLVLGYLSFKLAPQIVVQPIFLVGELALPAIIGLFAFKERKNYTVKEWVFLGVGVFGGYLVGTSI